jgi:GT2 family glycosyltransferase
VHHLLHLGAILYGGNFAVRRSALAAIGGFDQRIEFHGEDTNLGRRLTPVGRVAVCPECWIWTSARRYRARGKGKVLSLYVRNFWSEVLRHRPADSEHLDVRLS